ncbi:hypothetical protein [Streptomyces sp. 142MFCol3.1]|uniref:hypothetical protein n=1 Tax=Streptomyces sp. 142MFCol3.1 TaxID=1172179 RepID=UPI0003FB13C9|nr:hypothetical protein [Streptomyces sp. 142MFCol3.1]
MTTASYLAVADSARDPDADVWFAEPAGFVAVPMGALLSAPDVRDGKVRRALAPLLDAAPDEMARQVFLAHLAQGQQLLGALGEVGTVHCSIGLHRDDVVGGGSSLLSLFTVSWKQTAVASRGATAARAVATAEGHTRIEYVELPCGPAALSETTLTPSACSGLPRVPLLQIHAYVPHPDCRRLVVLTMSTTATAYREQYRLILRQMAELVSFDDPLERRQGTTK